MVKKFLCHSNADIALWSYCQTSGSSFHHPTSKSFVSVRKSLIGKPGSSCLCEPWKLQWEQFVPWKLCRQGEVSLTIESSSEGGWCLGRRGWLRATMGREGDCGGWCGGAKYSLRGPTFPPRNDPEVFGHHQFLNAFLCTVVSKLITDRDVFWGELMSNCRYISITETDLWKFQQKSSHYRYRFSLEFQEFPLQIQISRSKQINSVIISATTVFLKGQLTN